MVDGCEFVCDLDFVGATLSLLLGVLAIEYGSVYVWVFVGVNVVWIASGLWWKKGGWCYEVSDNVEPSSSVPAVVYEDDVYMKMPDYNW